MILKKNVYKIYFDEDGKAKKTCLCNINKDNAYVDVIECHIPKSIISDATTITSVTAKLYVKSQNDNSDTTYSYPKNTNANLAVDEEDSTLVKCSFELGESATKFNGKYDASITLFEDTGENYTNDDDESVDIIAKKNLDGFYYMVKSSQHNDSAIDEDEEETLDSILTLVGTVNSRYDDFVEAIANETISSNSANFTTLENLVNGYTEIAMNTYKQTVDTDVATFKSQVNSQLSGLASGEPKVFDTSTNILAKTSNSGIALGTDDGHKYYWNGTAYVDGGVYQASKIVDGSITPEKTNFVSIDGVNILDLTTISEGYVWQRQYGVPSTIYKKVNSNGFCFEPVLLKANKTYFTTPSQAGATVLLIGTWNASDNSYTGSYYIASSCSFVTLTNENPTGYGNLIIKPTQDCYLFFASTIVQNIGNPNTAMIYDGDSLPSEYKEYNVYQKLIVENLFIDFNYHKTIVVDKSNKYADYNTIQEACDNANDGDTILIYPGEYYERIICIDKEINLVGISKEKCVIWYDSDKYIGGMPLSIAYGSVQNITIKAVRNTETTSSTNLPYAVHIDYDIQQNKELKFINVDMIGGWQAACGIGLKGGFKLTFEKCNFISDKDTTNGALFFHDNTISGFNGTSYIKFDTCNIINKNGSIAIMPKSFGSTENTTYMTFYRTMIFSSVNGKSNGSVGVGRSVQGDGWRLYNNFFLTNDSFCNNNDLFNK